MAVCRRRGRRGEHENVRTRGVTWCLQGAVAALLLLWVDTVGHEAEAGLLLEGDETGTEDEGGVAVRLERTLAAHVTHALVAALDVLLTQQASPTWTVDKEYAWLNNN